MRRDRRQHRWNRSLGAAVLLAAVLSTAGAAAQPLTIPRFNFNFSNPGARSLGFAGAFAALADDATAAFANPAGLVQLTRPEVSLEIRRWSRSPSFIAGGRTDGEPTGIGLDTAPGLLRGRDSSRTVGPSFAAVVLPKGRWCFGLYGHRLARFEISTESQGFFFADPETPTGTGRFPASRESVDLEVVTAGFAAALRVNDRLSLGLGIVHSDLSLTTTSDLYLPDDNTPDSLFGEISFRPDRQLSTSRLAIDGGDWTLNGGLLWSATDRLSAGLFYRQGARATGTDRFEFSFLPFDPPLPLPPELSPLVSVVRAELHVPDVGGGGLAYRSAGGGLTVAGEVDRVGYAGLVQLRDSEDTEVDNRPYLDAWEYHLGAEYALLRRQPILAFRAGAWVEDNGADQFDDRFTHLAVGLGLAGERFQVDLAADFSAEIDTASVSFIYSF